MARVAKEQEDLEERFGESEDKRKRTKRALREALDTQASAAATPQPAETTSKPLLEVPQPGVKRRQTIAELTNNDVSDDDSEEEEEFFDAVDAGEVEVLEAMPSPPVKSPESEVKPIMDAQVDRVDESVEAERERKKMEIAKSFRGYEDGLRKRLKLDADNRPKVGLWVSQSLGEINDLKIADQSTGHPQVYDRQGHDQDDSSCLL